MNTEQHRFSIRNTAFILASLLFGGCAKEEIKTPPQDALTIDYSFGAESMLIGDQVELVVTAWFPTNGVLNMPELGHEKDVIMLKRDWEDIPREDGLTQTETRYTLTSFQLGEHVVSTNRITCAVGGDSFSTNFPAVTLNVKSSLPDDASSEIADIKPVHRLPRRMPMWAWVALGSALAAFLIGLITAKLWKHRETLIPQAPPIPPYVIARHALEALKNRGLLERDECEPFYTELSLILRTYLDGRFKLNAPDETTEEIVAEMSRSPELNETQHDILREFMTQADLVKFAKGHPDRATMENAFATTERFVEETKQTGDLAAKERREPKNGAG